MPTSSPFREKVLEVDHLHHDSNVLLGCRTQVVSEVTLSLQLEHHLFNGQALPADAAELVSQAVGHALQSILDERLTLNTHSRYRTLNPNPNRTIEH